MVSRIAWTRLGARVLMNFLIVTAAGLNLSKGRPVPLPQGHQSSSSAGGQPVIKDGRPAILLGGTVHNGLLISPCTYHGQQGLLFPAQIIADSRIIGP